MSEHKKPTEAEEIFSEFKKTKDEEKKSEPAPEPEPVAEPAPEPEPVAEPAPEPEPVAEKSTEQVKDPEPTQQTTTVSEEKSPRGERNVVYVGTKPLMTYVTATLTQLSVQSTVTIKARGRRITQAVDVSQMLVKRMNTVGFEVSDVRIASDSLTSQDGRLRNVSTMEIDISKT